MRPFTMRLFAMNVFCDATFLAMQFLAMQFFVQDLKINTESQIMHLTHLRATFSKVEIQSWALNNCMKYLRCNF